MWIPIGAALIRGRPLFEALIRGNTVSLETL